MHLATLYEDATVGCWVICWIGFNSLVLVALSSFSYYYYYYTVDLLRVPWLLSPLINLIAHFSSCSRRHIEGLYNHWSCLMHLNKAVAGRERRRMLKRLVFESFRPIESGTIGLRCSPLCKARTMSLQFHPYKLSHSVQLLERPLLYHPTLTPFVNSPLQRRPLLVLLLQRGPLLHQPL